MAASRISRRTYKQIGVLLPLERDGQENQRVLRDSEVVRNDEFMDDGFLFVRPLKMGPYGKYDIRGERISILQSVFVVQSVSTGELFINKLKEAPWDPVTLRSLPLLELRASTYRRTVGDPNIDFPGMNTDDVERKGVLPNIPCFNKLRFWQELDPRDDTNPDCTVYSLFFEFCNGGTIDQLLDKYQDRETAIPEHFIWLVAEQLFLALVAMKFGRFPVQQDGDNESRYGSSSDEDSVYQSDNWARIYHRDLHANNVFINYPPRGSGRVPKTGLESNAFPEIVVGDFGNSGIEGDDTAILPVCVYPEPDGDSAEDEGFLAEWEDIYSVGELLRQMVMTHIPDGGDWGTGMRPNCGFVQDANQMAGAPPYSLELIALLQLWEYPTQDSTSVRDLRGAVDTQFPSPEEIRDTLLPQAQARVAGFRSTAGRPAGYFDSIAVSWTRPEELRPFNYIMRHAAEAGDGPDGGPPPDEEEDDEDSEDGDGDAAGGDAEMSDSPSSPEAAQDGNDDQPDDGPQQQEGQESPSGADDDNHDDNHDDDNDEDGEDGEDGEDDDDDDDDESSPSPAPPPRTSEQLAMRELGSLHKWNGAKPRYELVSLEFGIPAVTPLKRTPP